MTADMEDVETAGVEHTKSYGTIESNELYLYSDIDRQSSYTLNKSLTDVAKFLSIQRINLGLNVDIPIKLYIQSDGGEVFGALSTVDRIRSSTVPVHSYVEGMVASAASLISISCHRRYVHHNAVMMIHQIRSWFGGTYENFKDESANLDTLTAIVTDLYLKHSKFTRSELNEILKHDIYLKADDIIKYGLADEII